MGGSGPGPLGGLGVNILKNLIPHLQAFWDPIIHFAWMIGVFLIIGGTAVVGRMRANPAYAQKAVIPIMTILVGFLLINVASSMDTATWTLFQVNAPTGLSYMPPNPASVESVYVQFAVYVVQLVGAFGFIYGIMIWRRLGDGSGQYSFWRGLTHVIGGTLSLNVVVFAHYLGSSMGAQVNSVLTSIIGP